MGTDVFLTWDGITENESELEARNSEFRVGAHLRAAIWMHRENDLLNYLFDGRYWSNEAVQGLPYDFKAGLVQLERASQEYLTSVGSGTKPEFGARNREEESSTRTIEEGYAAEDLDLVMAQAWLENVFEFFRLGAAKQGEGRNPRVYISW